MISQEMIDAAADALANEPLLFGESVSLFEEEFARFCGTDYAVSVNSGTDALIFTLMAAGVEKKHVLTTPSSYIATANSAVHAKAKPVFCDIDKKTNNISPKEIAKAVKKDRKIAAIIPVHLHGYPAAMDEINGIAEKRGLFVLEDACQAHGALYSGKRTGSLGNTGAFSFNPVKNMTIGGDGGMVTTNDEKIAKKVRMLADSGRENPYTHEHEIVGFTSRISSVSAAIGRVQLRHLDSWNAHRGEAAKKYTAALAGIEGLILPEGELEDVRPVFNKYAIKSEKRDGIRSALYAAGIESDSHYPIPIHLQPPYRKMGHKKGEFPNAERFADTTLSLPMAADMTEEEIGTVCRTVREFLKG